jgi:hypothetical protein
MGTFNACTVREEARLVELAHCAEERGVEILGVQEHRRVHTDDQIVYHKVERCTFITSSAWRNEAQAAWGYCWALGRIRLSVGFTNTPKGSLSQSSHLTH